MARRESEYSKKLRDPRWQKKRLEIFERDNWTCLICGDAEATLNVHHRYYTPGCEPWDCPNDVLATLCQSCHEIERVQMQDYEKLILNSLKEKFFADDLLQLASDIHLMELIHSSDVVASAYGWAFSNPEIQKLIIDMYMDQLTAVKKESERGVD